MNARPNIVLIHGAWAEGSCWSGVIERLQAGGYHVTAPQFPLTALADDVARLRQVLELQDGPTIVAGHSYGGQVMTALGADAPNVAGLVYIAAFGLDQGESLGGLLAQGPVTPALAHLFTDQRGFGWLSEDDFVHHFAADVDPVQAKVMYAVQQPLAMSAFEDVMGVPRRPGVVFVGAPVPGSRVPARQEQLLMLNRQVRFGEDEGRRRAGQGGNVAWMRGGHDAAAGPSGTAGGFLASSGRPVTWPSAWCCRLSTGWRARGSCPGSGCWWATAAATSRTRTSAPASTMRSPSSAPSPRARTGTHSRGACSSPAAGSAPTASGGIRRRNFRRFWRAGGSPIFIWFAANCARDWHLRKSFWTSPNARRTRFSSA